MDSSNDNSSSIYERFKQNTHKIFNDESFKDTASRGHQKNEGRKSSMNTNKRDSNKSRGHEYRNFSQAPVKTKIGLNQDNDVTNNIRSGSKNIIIANNIIGLQNKISAKESKKYTNNPIKLDKSLKSIENRILQKMKNKRDNKNLVPKMPTIERNHSPTISYGKDLDSAKLTIGQVYDYNAKSSNKKYKHRSNDPDSNIRQTISSAFQPNDADSFINKLNYVKPNRDSQSEYDLYNSYGSSNGFASDEKRMSNNMKYKIKASFRYRDEIETAETDSLFSSKFSKFSPSLQGGVGKSQKSVMDEMIKRQQSENGMPINFPSIKKSVPSKGSQFNLPSLK